MVFCFIYSGDFVVSDNPVLCFPYYWIYGAMAFCFTGLLS